MTKEAGKKMQHFGKMKKIGPPKENELAKVNQVQDNSCNFCGKLGHMKSECQSRKA